MRILKPFKRIGAVLLSVLFAMTALTACGDDEYASYSEDKVGIWSAAEGIEIYYSESDYAYRFYEFTSDGKLYYHSLSESMGDIVSSAVEFTINENYFIVNGSRALISIDGDNMTMTNSSGDQNYVRISMEEATAYGVYYVDSELYNEQANYMIQLQTGTAEESESDTLEGEDTENTEE